MGFAQRLLGLCAAGWLARLFEIAHPVGSYTTSKPPKLKRLRLNVFAGLWDGCAVFLDVTPVQGAGAVSRARLAFVGGECSQRACLLPDLRSLPQRSKNGRVGFPCASQIDLNAPKVRKPASKLAHTLRQTI